MGFGGQPSDWNAGAVDVGWLATCLPPVLIVRLALAEPSGALEVQTHRDVHAPRGESVGPKLAVKPCPVLSLMIIQVSLILITQAL
ncbi:hypothetical protein D3C87_1704980 [compost metagenome]